MRFRISTLVPLQNADEEYTGSQVAFLEQAMRVTMADSLRELMKDLLKELEANGTVWSQNASATNH